MKMGKADDKLKAARVVEEEEEKEEGGKRGYEKTIQRK